MKGSPTGFWAKLHSDYESGDVVAWNPLAAHSADVAACVEGLLDRSILGERLARIIGWDGLNTPHIHRLCVLAAIHDAGKVNHGFQRRQFPGAERVGHVGPLVDVLAYVGKEKGQIIDALRIVDMVEWFDGGEAAIVAMLLATWGHHGKPVRFRHGKFVPEFWHGNDERDPIDGIRRLTNLAFEWFPEATEPAPAFPDHPPFQHAFNGLLTLADWLGSDEKRFFPFADVDDDFIVRARSGSKLALEAFGLDADSVRTAMGKAAPDYDRFASFQPNDMQQTILELPDDRAGGLTILESDTGSGKTEAAIARFLRLFHAGCVDGMYFALPTRAAATQLYERVCQAIERTFADRGEPPPVVQAVPGYLSVDGQTGQRLPHFRVQWPDERWSYRGWAAEGPKRYLAASIAVGTVDQVLMSALQLKHAHMRASALLRHLLVVDEVHASDPYMSRLLEDVLDHHLTAGGHALLMSATLGSALRTRFTRGPKAPVLQFNATRNEPYPLITHADGARQTVDRHPTRPSGYTKRVWVEDHPIAADPNAIADVAAAAARDGARVLVIRNLVRDCVATQSAVEAALEPVHCLSIEGLAVPHHSRYAASDRRRLDRQIERDFGKESTRGSVVAIATQTVEQSLDIDADLLITDLCPMDVLLQRIGRLHRHGSRLRPPGYTDARVLVIVPEDRDLGQCIEGPDWRSFGDHGLGPVYADLRVLEATWRLIEERSLWTIPDDNRTLVEGATHPEALEAVVEELEGNWPRHQQWVHGVSYADRLHAHLVTLPRDKPFGQELFPNALDEDIRTRLGASDRRVEFTEPVRSPLGNAVSEMNLPEWMVPGVPGDIAESTAASTDDGFEFSFGELNFTYDRWGFRPVDEEDG